MKNQDVHLNEDRIIRAIVDENDLTTSEKNHLSNCSVCQKEKQEFEQVLSRMGDMSQDLVPSPRRKFIFTPQKNRSWFEGCHHSCCWGDCRTGKSGGRSCRGYIDLRVWCSTGAE